MLLGFKSGSLFENFHKWCLGHLFLDKKQKRNFQNHLTLFLGGGNIVKKKLIYQKLVKVEYFQKVS